MAGKNIKGITIEIGGNTTKLQDALKDVDKQVYGLNSDLKALNQALKLDPKNTELLSQKHDVLKRNIEATTERLNTLKEAQRQMGDYNKLTDEQKSSYNQLSLEIEKGEKALKDMNKEMLKTSGIDLDKVKEGLKKVGEVALDVSKKMLQVTTAISGALAGLVGAGVKSYAEMEQNLGGVETLFGESAEKVIENAKNAYKTAGVSANEYMAGVTSFSASLLQSLGGDTEKAAEISDMAFRDMSDNANKFGTDMSSIQSAYQGFAKQNYTMLDNLKLGYGGTKTEMERLLKDAEKISGVKYDIKNLSDVYSAIHVIQEEMGVTGTTFEEAEKTISGSANAMKSAFDNFINGSGSPQQLGEAITNFVSNVANAIQELAPSILEGVTTLLTNLVPQIGSILISLIPQLFDAVSSMIDQVLALISSNTSGLANTLSDLINKVVQFITTNLPKIIKMGLELIVALAQGIAQSIPDLIPTIVDCVITIVDTLIQNLPMIIEASIQIIVALIQGIIEAIPKLIDYTPKIIETIVRVLIENLPKLIEASIQIIVALVNGLIQNLPTLIAYIPKITIAIVKGLIEGLPQIIAQGGQIIASLITGIASMFGNLGSTIKDVFNKVKDGLKDLPKQALNWGKDMISGLADGIKGAVSKVKDAVKGVANKIKEFLHFSRPDTGPLREYEKWMPDFIQGLAKGINRNAYLVEKATSNLANKMSIDNISRDVNNALIGLSGGIERSINPTINPSFNSEANYTMMADAMKEALNDMTVELDDRQVGKFVIKTVTDEVYS